MNKCNRLLIADSPRTVGTLFGTPTHKDTPVSQNLSSKARICFSQLAQYACVDLHCRDGKNYAAKQQMDVVMGNHRPVVLTVPGLTAIANILSSFCLMTVSYRYFAPSSIANLERAYSCKGPKSDND